MNFLVRLKRYFWYFDAYLAARKYKLDDSLVIFGVTGTDGKTTTSTFLYEIAKAHGHKPFMMTTVGAKFDDQDLQLNIKSLTFLSYSIKNFQTQVKKGNLSQAIKSIFFLDKEGYENQKELHRTTPLASEIRKYILEYKEKGADIFIVEVTSHAIDQYRTLGIKFDSIGFTNITQEHLDYHGTWESYAETKAQLMNAVKPGGTVVINEQDQKTYDFLYEKFKKINNNLKLLKYKAENYEELDPKKFLVKLEEGEETRISAHTLKDLENNKKYHLASIALFGRFNLFNALAAISIYYGFDNKNIETSLKGIANLKSIKGRMNVISDKPAVIIDYAHTPNAMQNVLSSIDRGDGRLWVIFGCTGLRDKYKRPEMGRIAFENADNIMITADDVRTESLYEINNQIIEGFKKMDENFTIETFYPELEYAPEENKRFIVRFDEPNPNSRRNAIKFAIENASPQDKIVMLGIGHQNSILIGETDYEWNDENVAREYLNEK